MAENPTYAELKERVQNLEKRITTQNRFQNISRSLFKISSAVNTTSNLSELYKSIHNELSSVIDTTNFFIAIYDSDKDSIAFQYCVDSVDKYYPPVIGISKAESLTAKVIRTGLPLLITKDEILSQRQKSQRIIPGCTPSEIWLGVPLIIETNIIGVMAVQSYDDANCYDQTDLEVMVSVADQVAIAIDRKSSEKTLQESEERYRRLAENSPDLLFRISLPDGKYEYVSPAAEKIFGYPPKTWYTTPLLIKEIIHPDFDNYFIEQWEKLINGFAPPAYEYKIVHKDKSERWINQRNFLVKDDHGQPIALEGVVSDFTERKQAEELLRQSENKLRSTLDATPFPVAVVDFKDDKIIYWSSSALELFGHTAPTTSEWYEIAYPDPEYRQDVIERWKPFLEIAQESGKPVNTGEYQITCKDGAERICELHVSFLPDNLIVTFNDITKRKQAEKEKRNLETQLQQAQKMETIGNLAGGIAHEFNNMLAIIMGNNELIMEALPQGSLAYESTEEIRIAGIRARDVVKQLLTFSRQDDAVKKVMDLKFVVQESLKLIRSSTPVNIKIEQNLSADTYPVIGNGPLINQLLITLCNNAVDALPELGGLISIELLNESIDKQQTKHQIKLNPGQYAKLMVSDNGTGMDKEILDRMFEPYFTTKDIGEGTGIGMAVVHGIVERHGGTIIVDSKPGRGTTFTIFLPAHEDLIEQENDKRDLLPAGDEHILYVDDEPSIAILGKRLLESLGYTTDSVSDPEQALDMLRSDPSKFDLLITDMAMPNLTGDQLVIEALRIRQDMPTIICTGYSSTISEEEASDIGVRSFIMKPINKSELAKKVRKVLDGCQ